MEGIGLISYGVFFVCAAALYFTPALVAKARRKENVIAISVLNLFLGWTVIGWVGALVWAFTKGGILPEPTKQCPHCQSTVRQIAATCTACGKWMGV